jgi:hypothetical protein
MINIGIALANSEDQIFNADPNNLDEKNKHVQRMRHRNQLLEKFYAGKHDEDYFQKFYDILKKADKFLRRSTSRKIAVAADKHGSNFGQKDQYGRRYEHFGFFDDKHKHAGKTVGEVIDLEFEERRTKDDNYELLQIFNNKPTEVGLLDVYGAIKDIDENESDNFSFDFFNKSKQFKFPIAILRNDDKVLNKIEHLTEFLHIKKIGFEYRQLEFFIPLKFKTIELVDDSQILKELIDINNVHIYDEYGQLNGWGIIEFTKRTKHNDTHEVFKFKAIEMKIIKG